MPDICVSAADMDIDIVGGIDEGMVEGTDDPPMAETLMLAHSGSPHMKANGKDQDHTNNNNSVPDISTSAVNIKTDVASGLDEGMVEGTEDSKLPAAASGDTSSQTQTQTQVDQDAVLAEQERIFMSDINQMIDQYNAKNKQQDDASMNFLPHKRPASTLTVTNKRRKESTGMLQKDAPLTIKIHSKYIEIHFVSFIVIFIVFVQ